MQSRVYRIGRGNVVMGDGVVQYERLRRASRSSRSCHGEGGRSPATSDSADQHPQRRASHCKTAPPRTPAHLHSTTMSQLGSQTLALHRQLCRSGTSLAAAGPRAISRTSRRSVQDIAITRTGKPIIRTVGGRSSLGGHTATVFGATGFLGRYIVNRLARSGCTVVVPFREEMAKRHLKVSGDLGRVVFLEYDLRNTASIEESVRHSDIVYNLVGRDYSTKNFDLEDVHVEGAHRIASAVAKYDVDRFVHVSSHSASTNSPSVFYRTKAEGEKVVRDIFPETTIIRPAPMFGFEDRLLHRLAGAANVITSNHLQEKFRPVHVIDVGQALEQMLYDDSTAADTYELYGPKEYTMADISALVDREIIKHRRHINVSRKFMEPVADILNKALWWPTTSRDQVVREFIDQVIDPKAKTFKDLDIEPGDIANFTFKYLQGYRSSAYYDLPPMTEREKREEKKYLHVIDDQ
ncbi:Protein-lysine N-methyltransferase efm5 [Zalaria obscura]|uniref:Protein-lysine N-methyltransferase efm5 n=1 Tax=Zalaria obscura TaxID=2024903 RepID=A0ACC3SS21_9PEZI